MTTLSDADVARFREAVLAYHKKCGRDFPWRRTRAPYRILVSEMMLQQTQTSRVLQKYDEWLLRFPDVASLASASLSDALAAWSGLGYNRRAKYLRDACILVCERFGGTFPRDAATLKTLPGIGAYTAGAVSTFAFNNPEVFIETNIRSTFIFFFFNNRGEFREHGFHGSDFNKVGKFCDGEFNKFRGDNVNTDFNNFCGGDIGGDFNNSRDADLSDDGDSRKISDAEIMPLVERTLDKTNPRVWYYALMDYGAELKKRVKNPSRKSASYSKQSKFKGSLREARGAILRWLSKNGDATLGDISRNEKIDIYRLRTAAEKLCAEKLVCEKRGIYRVME